MRKNRREILQAVKLIPSSFRQGQCRDYRHEIDEIGAHLKKPDVKKPIASGEPQTETAFAFDVNVDLPRWRGVRFEFRSGKYLREQKGIEYRFKDGTKRLFSMEKTETGHADAYKILINKAFAEDQSYFVGILDIMAEWKIIDQVREQKSRTPLIIYEKGASGAEVFGV